MTLNEHVSRALSAFAIVGTLAFGAWAGQAIAHADQGMIHSDQYAWEVGDDNADGVIDEDESGWDCATMGNLICGPAR